MKDFLDEHFNLLLIATLVVFFALITLHIIHHTQDADSVKWIEGLTGQFASTLFTLLVARHVSNGGGGNGGSAPPPTPPSSTTDKKSGII